MKLTTKGRYAVTAMLDLAISADERPVSLAEISERQEISLSYLEQLFAKLRKHELVVSTRGPGGGYRVARNLSDVAVGEIISAVDESVDATHCGGKKNCHNHGRCLTHDLWAGLSEQIETFLNGVSLQDLINNHAKNGHGNPSPMAAIELSQSNLGQNNLTKRTLSKAQLSQKNLDQATLVQSELGVEAVPVFCTANQGPWPAGSPTTNPLLGRQASHERKTK